MAVGWNWLKTQRRIEPQRLGHRGERVQAHAVVSDFATSLNNGPCQLPANSASAKRWPDIEPFHFADTVVDFPQGDAACSCASPHCQQQASRCGRITAWKLSQLPLVILKTQVRVERIRIFQEQLSNGGEIFLRMAWDYHHRGESIQYSVFTIQSGDSLAPGHEPPTAQHLLLNTCPFCPLNFPLAGVYKIAC